MNYVVLTNDVQICSFLGKVSEKYPKSCRLYLNKNTFKENRHLLDERPILRDHFMVTLTNVQPRQAVEAMQTDNLVFLKLKNLEEVKEYSVELNSAGVEYRFVDDTKKRDYEVISWVMSELSINEKDAKYLCNRHAVKIATVTPKTYGTFNINAVVNSVNILRTLDVVDRKAIKTYTDRKLGASLNSIIDSLLGVCTLPRKSVIATIARYQYGLDFLLSFIKKALDEYLLVYTLIEEGEVSYENYKDYSPPIGFENFTKITEYRRKKILDTYSKVSFDMLYFTKLHVESIPTKRTCIYQLILLLKEGVSDAE